MKSKGPRGVVAAIATPVTNGLEPDIDRFLKLAAFLLENGCDGLNVLGTTGEATSFSLDQRRRVMRALASSGLDLSRMLVGTGAAALEDAAALTREASKLGFAGALVLPPFYYKNVPDDGIAAYIDAIVARSDVPIYLYHFPAQSGVPYSVELVARLLERHPDRLAGLKDSSGDMAYAGAVADLSADFAVFPSTEAVLMEARDGRFAGCISATANLNASFCARAFHDGDAQALQTAKSVRALFDGKPLVPGVKALLARIHGDEAVARVLPPLAGWKDRMTAETFQRYRELTANG